MSLAIAERVPGFDPAEFWRAAPGPETWAAMVAKYEILAELAGLPDDEARKPRLRAAASRWPGSLREAELIGPDRVAERGRAAAAGLAEPERPRAHWAETPACAVLLWAELHRLLDDQLRFRTAAASDEAGSSEAFARWIVGDVGARRWPAAARIPALLGAKLRVRSAYLWLAARAGLALPDLNAQLLARAGHWDRRPEDPSWAHSE